MEHLGQTAQKLKDNGAVQQLLRSDDTRRMMELLGSHEKVKGAAKAAAAGNPSQLMGMMQQLMSDPEGARLVEQITKQAEQSGL
ncbi:MAG: hypothetical protein IKB79_06845 [Oscillospiraceae bacterium]|nr:hypothetical protein [Oscillospiraceae bacterium]